MASIQIEAQFDCHHALADKASEKAKWELTELDTHLAWEWTRRELSLVASSITLEGILRRRMEKCADQVAEERGNRRLKEWMQSEFVIGQRKRLEKERGEMKERMEEEMKAASERAEGEGRLWRDQWPFYPQKQWEAGLKFIDDKWCSSIEGGPSALENAVSDLDKSAKENWDSPREIFASEETEERFALLEQVRKQFDHWDPQREKERHEMDATIKRISDADSKDLGDAYQYPKPDSRVTQKFVNLCDLESALVKFCSATVYDVEGCDIDKVCDAIDRSTTRSVMNVDPALVDSIPENDHLLYIGSDSGKEPAFIQRNRDQWWDQQMTNSSMFYFSPQGPQDAPGLFVSSRNGTTTIAHIFIFLKTPSRLQLRLLHCRSEGDDISVSIQENSHELRHISTDDIPEKFELQDFELHQFEPGRHELELIVICRSEEGIYGLRDIFIEFINNPPQSHSSVAKDGSNMVTMEEHRGVDAEPGGI
jgi:hypothetical protein